MTNGKRKNSHQCLFEFNSLVDMHLGVVMALQKDFPSGGLLPTINYSFLHQSLDELKQFRMFAYGKNVVQECFAGSAKQSYETIYKTYCDKKISYDLAPHTLLVKLVKMYNKTGFIKSTILCHSPFEYDMATSIFGSLQNCVIVPNANEKSIDVNEFARIHIGDIRDLDLFNPFDCTHIAVLNYGSNLQVMHHINDVTLLSDYVIRYGDTNVFEIIDSYSGIACPEYGKIRRESKS